MQASHPPSLARSFVHRRLAEAGAAFDRAGRALEVPGGTRGTLSRLGLVDLSPLPRIGLKGRGAVAAAKAAGVHVEAEPNRAFRQGSDGLCAVLGPGEIVLLSGLDGRGALVRKLEGWPAEGAAGAYPTPRASSHAWLRVVGEASPEMFAKLCGVDLRPHKFADLRIAQTSVARLTGIVIRDDLSGTPAYHLLADGAAADYLWRCVLDAMAEFGGGPAGLSALRELAGSDETAEGNAAAARR